MTACLNDLSYIPLNYEQNEPTQGDIGETKFFHNVFPTAKGYKLPPSYYAINKTFKKIGLGYESTHACEHDCCLFQGDDNKDLDFYPLCNTSRWKDSNTPGKKVPKKVLRYFLIIPRLQRLYKSSHTAKEMIWPATGKCMEPEPRNVQLGLAVDGFNPFGNLSQAYSMWPVILTTYNLPPWLCMKDSSFMLALLTPGPKSPGKDIDVYLNPLIEDLKVSWDRKGVETIDVASGQKFNMRAMVLWTINDFPARSSLSGGVGKTRLAKVGYSKWLVAWPNQKREVLEASGCVFFYTIEPKKFCQFIKGVKLPDGFRSCFKHKVTDNDNNITGLKSHDCHIMMQRLLPYGLQNYLSDKIAKPIIELCSLSKQICSATLMEDDMLKAQIKVVDILCDLELIYPPALFDIMIHLVIHLPLEALEGGPIRKDVTTKFNRPGRNVDPPPPTCQFQVFRLVCKSNGLRLIIRFDAQGLKKVKCLFLNKDMKEELPYWFGSQIRQRHVDNDKDPEVDVPPDIIDVVDEDDDITDDEDTLPHDLAYFDNKDLINVDDDGVDKVYSSEED
nr:hypothetical protein [Tanacetum cinerariifolium]